MWQQYVLPAVLYGTEIMDLNSTYVKDLETVQCGLMKNVLRVIPGTANACCYAVTGLMDIKNEIFKKKLAYFQHVHHMHEERWCVAAYKEQRSWGIQDNAWDDNGVRIATNCRTKNKFWLNEIHNLASDAKVDLAQIGRLNWKSEDFKIFFNGKQNRELLIQIAEHPTLTLLGPIHRDHDYDNITQSWWLKAKLGSIRLHSKNNPDKICYMCGQTNDNMIHMLTCDKYPQCFITDIIDTIPDLTYIWEWLLHYDRSSEIRVQTSRWIHSRWRAREQTILRSRETELNNIGIYPEIPPPPWI